MKYLTYLCQFFVLIMAGGNVVAQKQYTASNAGELKTIVSDLKPGDVVSLTEGVWKDIEIILESSGTSAKPIIVRAKTPGKTIITGNSSFKVGGAYVVIRDLVFKNVNPIYVKDDAIIGLRAGTKEARNVTIRNCRFSQDESLVIPNDRAHGFFWVDVYGSNNIIDGCTFQGKKNWLPIIDIKTKNKQQGHHIIQNNIFCDTKPQPGISLESIRVGMREGLNSYTMIRNNLFLRCNGDSEIISTKSHSNYIYDNYFVRCYASVCLRGGNGVMVKGNYFYYTLGGIRVNGSNHHISGNYFYHVQDNPVALMMGSNNKDCGYQPVTNITIDSNYFVNNAKFVVLEHYNNKCDELPKQIGLKNNFLLGPDGQEKKLGEGDVMTRKQNEGKTMMAKKKLPANNRVKAAPAGKDKRASSFEIQVEEDAAKTPDAAALRSDCDYYTKNVLNNLNSKLNNLNIKGIPDKSGSEDRQLAAKSNPVAAKSKRGNIFEKIGAGF